MSIVPGVREAGDIHPAWCVRRHGDRKVHERKVGVDLELSGGLQFGVGLQYVEGQDSTNVLLMEHTSAETSLTKLSLFEAAVLRDLLSEALGLVGHR